MDALESFQGLDQELPLDADGGKSGYLVIGPNGAHVRLSASAYHLLQAARSGLRWDALAEAMSRHQGRPVSASELEASHQRIVDRLQEIDSRSAPASLPSGFWLRWRLIPAPVVGRIAARLSGFFAPKIAGLLLALIVLALGHAIFRGVDLSFDGGVFWPAYGLFTLSLIAHELGHVSACRRFGARPNDIGFTVYWIFPAFYSDVTTAWQLQRRHRVVVDLGGAYFQLMVGCLYWLGFLATGWRALEVAFLMILYGCLFSLNPIFKFDGYWVLADALGLTRLSEQPKRIVRHLLDRLRGRATEPLPWPPWIKAVLFVYTPLTLAFWIFFVARLAPEVWQRAVAYPELISGVLHDLTSRRFPAGEAVDTLVLSTFLLLVSGLMLHHLLIRLGSSIARPPQT